MIRTRMAPSPTGDLHVGSMAVLLKNYALAKQAGGRFILRIEDTDKEREVPGAVERIMQVVKDYGLSWDEGPDVGGEHGPYIQSQRLDIYKDFAHQLVEKKAAYYCFCSKERLTQLKDSQRANKIPPKYDKHCLHLAESDIQDKLSRREPYVIRLNVQQNQDVKFHDLIRGEIVVSSNEVDDQVLLKSDGFPTYHLAVVVDDHLMKITHILRGEEWISSTPKHVLLYQAFGWQTPIFAHIPVFLNPDGQGKMSKRKGTVSSQSFLDAGYLPEALLNFFMILGWAREDQQEIMTLDEYVKLFRLEDLSHKSVVFDLKKLDWINGVYIRQSDPDKIKSLIKQKFMPSDFPIAKFDDIYQLVFERLVKLSDFEELTAFFYRDIENIDKDLITKKSNSSEVAYQLHQTISALEKVSEWSVANIEKSLRNLVTDQNYKKSQYFMMIRVSVTGKTATPPLFETIQLVGKDKTIQRLNNVLKEIA